MDNQMFNIGKVVNTHGIKGEVKIIKITDFDERFEKGNKVFWFAEDGKKTLSLEIDGHRIHKNFHLLHFKGYDSINDVESLKGGTLKISEEQQTSLEEGEFYYHQIIGCAVVTEDGTEIGIVKEILTPGANDVWVVKRKGQKDVLIPYIESIVTDVDVENKRILIHPMEGLLD
ncbi:ribosome maturation factor RimM [Salinibacillus xinjiangensis]|uniref:Ribosome maturation factor RimM n=1 Tax=Salinibacillus xinjiangensis TaxID=1229268 RepID=A0A6G1X360_9BACI|nr:ribosome maturation factor RimM [Salinibacillus xinjiangensis]MRG85423.1 ribosome maturation factor RimM [Salinibacillus xinjiangensis]